ncbi:MAG: hypothetical protein ONA90_09785 [candidate division KSB1 bacterium]|nr:hypothetical protein [candidate division KSB1 bacterium]
MLQNLREYNSFFQGIAYLQPDEQKLQELVQRIVDAVHPLRIILFGSAARGVTWGRTAISMYSS